MVRPAVFDAITEPVSRRIAGGFDRIAVALRSGAWHGAGPSVTPTQVQALAALRDSREGLRLAALAAELGVSAPTMSARVATLVTKGFVAKDEGPDKRSVRLRVTPAGTAVLEAKDDWPESLTRAVETLEPQEQEVLLYALVKVIRALQQEGAVAPARMCASCTHFRPFAHPEGPLPHHCDYVDAPFGDRHLRLSCPEHQAAPEAQQQEVWDLFTGRPQ